MENSQKFPESTTWPKFCKILRRIRWQTIIMSKYIEIDLNHFWGLPRPFLSHQIHPYHSTIVARRTAVRCVPQHEMWFSVPDKRRYVVRTVFFRTCFNICSGAAMYLCKCWVLAEERCIGRASMKIWLQYWAPGGNSQSQEKLAGLSGLNSRHVPSVSSASLLQYNNIDSWGLLHRVFF